MHIPNRWPRSAALAVLTTAIVTGIAGCGASPTISTPVTGQAFAGQIHGGNQPVANANIQIYAPGTNGYGTAATPLLTRTVTSNASGGFSFAGAYTCPSASTPIYLVVTGGNPGLAAGTNNNALALMGLLGPCGNLASGFFNISELTTVAAVWALAPFMVDSAHIGTSPGNVQGLLNAFATAQSLVSVYTGRSPGTAPTVANIPSAAINTLGDILSSCVNSNGSTALTDPCGRLFAAATPTGGTTPSDTIAAALDIARNPSHSVGSIFSTLVANGPYQPTLTSSPGDWTLAINYTSPSFSTPGDLAIDSQGNAWVLSTTGNASTVSVLNSTSGITSTFPQPGGAFARLALDPYDDPWLTNSLTSSVTELNSAGVRATSNPFGGAGIQGPSLLAFDGLGNVWVANSGPTVSKLSANGASLSPSTGFSTGGVSSPAALALDTSGNAWIADTGGNAITVLSNSGVPIPGSPYTGGGINGPFAVAIDSAGGAWIANRLGSSLSRLTSFGDPVAGSPYYGAGLNAPIDMAVDGLGNVWLVNSGSSTVSEFLSNGRPQSGGTGYGSSVLTNPFRLALDRSGNIWVANLGSQIAGQGTITKIVGAAAPVVTPVSIAIQNNALNQRP
ncbi:MAG TPA: NHL repeat-containing protein [Edaphobacter sp.]